MRAAYTSVMTQQSLTAARREAARERTGQFGEHVHSAPEVALALSVDDIDQASERGESAELFALARRAGGSAAWWEGPYRNRDDIIGDTIVEILHRRSRGAAHVEKQASQIATSAAKRLMNAGEHHTSVKGRRLFHEWTEAFIHENGRMPSVQERRAQADRIRLAEPAGQRPTPGFEERRVVDSLDDGEDYDGFELAVERGSDYATDTSRAAAANDMLEDEDSSFKAADARKCIWNLLAEDAPQVAVKTIDDDRAHRAAIDAVGGPIAAARAWASGEAAEDDPASVALFAPFGRASKLTEKQREQITDVLLRNPAYAMKVWDSAMSAALDVQRLRTIKRRESRQAAAQAERELIAA